MSTLRIHAQRSLCTGLFFPVRAKMWVAVSSVGTDVEEIRHSLIQWLQNSFIHKWEPFKLVQKNLKFYFCLFLPVFCLFDFSYFSHLRFFTTGKNHLHSNIVPALHWISPKKALHPFWQWDLLKGAKEPSLLFVLSGELIFSALKTLHQRCCFMQQRPSFAKTKMILM